MNIENVASYQGAYSGSEVYSEGDIVTYSSVTYISTVNSNSGNEPDTSPSSWTIVGQTNSSIQSGYAYNPSGTSATVSLPKGTYIVTYEVWNSGSEATISPAVSGYTSAPVPIPQFDTRGGSGQGRGIYTLTSAGSLTINNGASLYPVLITAVQVS
jgi:hypothetical protein